MRFCEAPNCPNPVFGTDKITRIGYCKSHQYKRTDLDKRSIVQKAMAKQSLKNVPSSVKSKVRGLLNTASNVKMIEGDKIRKAEEDLFWLSAEKYMQEHPNCLECNKTITASISRYSETKITYTNNYRNATAHILSKSLFPSVAFNLYNWLPLPASCCHDKTHRLDTFSKMRCFGEAVKRFRKFEHLITETHKILDEFKRLADEYEETEFFKHQHLIP